MTTVQSLDRAIGLLRLISSEHKSGARLSTLVAASGLAQPTVHRLLKQLVEGGLVMQDARRRYRLGHFAYELGLVASTHFNLRDQCAPFLARISAETGDTAFLVVRSGADSFCLDRQSGSFPIQVLTVEVGKRRPLGIGGGGLALLSFMPQDELPEVLGRIEPHLATYGGLTRQILLDLMEAARARGYASITNYAVAGVTSIGVPIRDRGGMVVGAISVSAMTARMQPREDFVVQTLQREIAALQKTL
ncbi:MULTISPECIES: IclR family transcriptional regulator [unclassified Acidovorax]|uniref:IclR family transcriptional regulator n=1 Tax=unclassified Acidovorax TaxID=2684926 RepID=UPI001C46C065|nr:MULTISPECIES: IclR family transcriptional regulator [unclassified Acidovorax]MBV7427542.1 IclR family transcriptional regulator [Acidovorax sp. sif0732]MBV7449902.1 IclR family transcriptional regulator [Acidovorax sp. sif0715]